MSKYSHMTKRILTVCLLAASATAIAGNVRTSEGTYLPGEGDISVSVYRTTERKPFCEVPTTPFTIHRYSLRKPIDIDSAEVRGRFEGVGVAMTDASAWLLSQLPQDKRTALLEAVFSPEKGAGLRGIRLNIGSSDYSTALYTYDDVAGDVDMKHFDISRDDHWLFPMVKEALNVNPDAFLFAAPWSAPGWMKDTGEFVDGHFKDGMEQAMANYLAAYVEACAQRGLNLRAVSVNNEVDLSTHGTYPSCVYSAKQEVDVVKLLRRALDKKKLGTGIWLYDHNYNGAFSRVAGQLADPQLRKSISGIAWHSYSGGEENLDLLRQQYPGIPYYHTEQGPALHDPSRTEYWWARRLRDAFENGCETFTGWNLCLTAEGEPLTGPHLCMGLVTLDPDTGDFTPSAQYNLFRHIGPFVKPGAEVLRASGDKDDMIVLLFRNPGDEYVLVAACTGKAKGLDDRKWNEPRPRLYVSFAGEEKELPMPYGYWSITTMVFKKK